MKKYLHYLVIVLLLHPSVSWGQTRDTVNFKHSIQIEGLGLGRYGSLSYRRMIKPGEVANFYLKGGVSMIRVLNYENKFKPDIIVPIMAEVVLGKKSHHLELSAGQVFITYSTFSVAKGGEDREKEFSPVLGAAYLYQRPYGRWHHRLIIYSILDDYELQRKWIGASTAYNFNFKRKK
ncbi:MAG: hypothetical protein COA58_04100 [Bacteroidetes bacterium]|nr:MAG: hypothetical protein COA58_04100 [Bacteroidota bacterium]